MIAFVKEAEPQSLPKEAEENRFDQIRKEAATRFHVSVC